VTFDGDPKMYSTGGESDLLIADGQPVMDEGLENAVFLSLFSTTGWWGNAVSSEDEKLGSELQTVLRRTLNNAARLDAEQYAKDALAWLLSAGIAKSVAVSATIPAVGVLGLVVTVEQPDRTSAVRYQINWAEMSVRTGAA
jgi:phage gp46-like protein